LESFKKSKEKLVPRIETRKQSPLRKHKAPSCEANPQATIGIADLKPIPYATRSMLLR